MTRSPEVVRLEYLPKLAIPLLLSPKSMVHDTIQVVRSHHRRGPPILLQSSSSLSKMAKSRRRKFTVPRGRASNQARVCAESRMLPANIVCRLISSYCSISSAPNPSAWFSKNLASTNEGSVLATIAQRFPSITSEKMRTTKVFSQKNRHTCARKGHARMCGYHRAKNRPARTRARPPKSTESRIRHPHQWKSRRVCRAALPIAAGRSSSSCRKRRSRGDESSRSGEPPAKPSSAKPASSVLSLISSNWRMSTSSPSGPHKKERERGFRIGYNSPQVVIRDV
jgi:hypothetical protein